ncbi:MAG: hypothetical protein R3C58_02660 [Parvularculaceae bacterium]
MLLQKALSIFADSSPTAGYMYYFDQNLITSLQELTLLIALGEALLAWVNIYTIGSLSLILLPSLVAYLLGLRAPHVLALLNAVGGITWSLVWIIGGSYRCQARVLALWGKFHGFVDIFDWARNISTIKKIRHEHKALSRLVERLLLTLNPLSHPSATARFSVLATVTGHRRRCAAFSKIAGALVLLRQARSAQSQVAGDGENGTVDLGAFSEEIAPLRN